MGTFLAAALWLLVLFDPVGLHFAHQGTTVETTRAMAGGAQTTLQTGVVEMNPDFLEHAFQDRAEALRWAACTRAHEGVHVERRDATELMPMLLAYMCLDRLGASAETKGYLYGRIAAEVLR